MKCIYCKQKMKIYEQYCPACGKLVIEGDPEFFEELKERSKIINPKNVEMMIKRSGLNQEPVVEVDNPAAMTILNCYWLENS